MKRATRYLTLFEPKVEWLLTLGACKPFDSCPARLSGMSL